MSRSLMKTRSNFCYPKSHNVWFDEYNSRISIEEKHTLGYLLLRQYHESHVHNSYLLNFIKCELDLIPTLFCDTKNITYEI